MYDPQASKLITLAQAGDYLGLTRSALNKAAASGTLWTIKPGKQHYTTIEQADYYRKLHADPKKSSRLKEVLKRKAERTA